MNFTTWTRSLTDRGLRILAPSHPAPVHLWALLPDGDAVHFRCRGTSVQLTRYAVRDLVAVPAVATCGCGCSHATSGGRDVRRTLPRPAAVPLDVVRWDGGTDLGWRAHEAGLLSVGDAAMLFDLLLARLLDRTPPQAVGYPGSAPLATGLDGSAVHCDQEPTYSAAGVPA